MSQLSVEIMSGFCVFFPLTELLRIAARQHFWKRLEYTEWDADTDEMNQIALFKLSGWEGVKRVDTEQMEMNSDTSAEGRNDAMKLRSRDN